MKATGMVRNVDELGRLVIPIELRRNLNISIKDPIEIFMDDDAVILKKYKADNSCLVTGEVASDNFSVLGGEVTLSPEGARKLAEEIASNLKEQ